MEIKIGTQFTTSNDVKIKVIDIFVYVSPSKNYDTSVIYEYQFKNRDDQFMKGQDKVSMENFIKEFYQ